MSTWDMRIEKQPVARIEFARVSWATGAGHAAKTDTIKNINGVVTRVDIIITAVTDNPTVTVSFADANGVAVIPTFSALADGTHHVKLARSNKATMDADFNEMPLCEDTLTVTVDPSADPGGTAQLLTVDVWLYMR